jgi:hypothetical protein
MRVSVKKVERAAAVHKKDPKKAQEVQAGTKKMVEAEQELKGSKQAPQAKFTFDAAGVKKYIPDRAARNYFWRIVEQAKIPFGWQAKLAALLQDEANRHNKGVVSRRFVQRYEEYIPLWVEHPDAEITEERIKEIMDDKSLADFKVHAEKLKSHLMGVFREGHQIERVLEKLPQNQGLKQSEQEVVFYSVFDNQFRRELKLLRVGLSHSSWPARCRWRLWRGLLLLSYSSDNLSCRRRLL